MNEKYIIVLIYLTVWTQSLEISVPGQIILQREYVFESSGAQGPVKYQFQNLPAGVNFQDNIIYIENRFNTTQGFYPARVRASDGQGNYDQKIIVIVIPEILQTQNFKSTYQISLNNQQKALQLGNGTSSAKQQTQNATISSLKVQNQSLKNIINSNQIGTKQAQLSKNQTQSKMAVSQPISEEINKNAAIISKLKSQKIETNSPTISVFPSDQITSNLKSSLPNPTIEYIRTNQASTSNLQVRAPTQLELSVAAAFDRQIRGQKAIANLLYLVMQSTASRNGALAQITKRQQLYKNNTNNLFALNQSLQKVQLSFQSSKKDLKQRLLALQVLQSQSQRLQKSYQKNRLERQKISQQKLSTQNELSLYEKQIDQLTLEYQNWMQQKINKNQQCNQFQKQIYALYDVKDQRQAGIYGIKIRLLPARKEVQNRMQDIEQIKEELRKAQERLDQAKSNVAELEAEEKGINDYIDGVTRNIKSVQFKFNTCRNQLQQLTNNIQKIGSKQLPELSEKKAIKKSQIQIKSQKIDQLDKFPPPKQSLAASQQKQLNLRVTTLNKQISLFQLQMQNLQYSIADMQQQVKQSKQNLDAASKRYFQQQWKVQDYTSKLEQARMEKQDADAKVSEMLEKSAQVSSIGPLKKEFVNIDPYVRQEVLNNMGDQYKVSIQTNLKKQSSNSSSATNGTQIKDIKTVAAKNISTEMQSLLKQGAINYIQPNKDGSYTIKNTPQFILYFFGPNIKSPSINTTTLYSPTIKEQQQNSKNTSAPAAPSAASIVAVPVGLSESAFNAQKNISFSGIVLSVIKNSFGAISEEGAYFEVFFSNNTKVFTTAKNLENFKPGMKVILRGNLVDDQKIASHLIFIYGV